MHVRTMKTFLRESAEESGHVMSDYHKYELHDGTCHFTSVCAFCEEENIVVGDRVGRVETYTDFASELMCKRDLEHMRDSIVDAVCKQVLEAKNEVRLYSTRDHYVVQLHAPGNSLNFKVQKKEVD